MDNSFFLALIAKLNKQKSKKQIQKDAKELGNIYVPIIGRLLKGQSKQQIQKDLSSITPQIKVSTSVNSKNLNQNVHRAVKNAQKNSKPISVNFQVKKEKLINDIKYLAKVNSAMFHNTDMSIKYHNLLDNAKLATSSKELRALKLQLSAIRSELKATGLAGKNMTDTFKSGVKRAVELFGSYGLIMSFTKQLRNAWNEAQELDESLTSLAKVSDEISRNNFPAYLDKCIKRTQELAVSTKDYIDSVTEFSKQGYSLADSEILAEKASQLSNVGDMSIEDATKTITSGIQGFETIDGYSVDELSKKVQALNDKLNEIGNTSSISTEELAEGVQLVGSVISDSNTSLDEFIALLGAGYRQVQNADKVALAIRTSALRIQGATADLQNMDEETDGVIESTAKLEKKIKALTDIDGSGGVEILEADGQTFKSIYTIYNDIAKVYQSMPDLKQNALLELIAGKNRSSQVSAILNNMAEANEILNNSLNAAGSATKEYNTYLGSAKAATTKFGNAMTETYNNIVNGDTVKNLANAGSAVVEFANSLGLVQSTLRGLILVGVVKAITTLSVAFKTGVVQANAFGTAMTTLKNMSGMAKGTVEYATAMNTLKQSCSSLTANQIKQVLASKNLSNVERIAILQTTGLTKAQSKARLTQLGYTQSTQAQNAAQNTATASTIRLSSAVKGFSLSLKAAFMSNPVGITIMAISVAIGAVTSAFNSASQKADEAKEKIKEAADEAGTLSSELSELTGKYLSLSKAVKTDTSSKEELMSVQEELIKKLGIEGESIDTLISKYGSLDDAIKNITLRELGDKENDLLAGVKNAEEDLIKIGKGRKNWYSLNDRNLLSSSGDDAVKAYEILANAGIIKSSSYGTAGGVITLTGDDTTVEGILENYQKLQNAMNALRKSNQFTESELKDNPVFLQVYNRAQEMKEYVDDYYNVVDDLNQNIAQQQMLTALQGRELPETEDEFNSFRDELIKAAQSSNEFIGSQDDIEKSINALLVTVPQFAKYYGELETQIEGTEETVDDLQDALSFSDIFNSSDYSDVKEKLLDLAKSGEITSEVLNSIEDYQKLLTETGLSAEEAKNKILDMLSVQEKLSAVDSGLDSLKSAYEEFKDKDIGFVTARTLDGLPDSFKELSGYDLFSQIAGDPTGDVEKIQKAFNDIVKQYLISQGTFDGLINASSHEIQSYIANLRQMGITNAEEVVNLAKSALSEENRLVNEATKEYYDAYSKYLESKDEADLEYVKSAASRSSELSNALGTPYKTDYNNWCNLLQKKAEAYNKFISELGKSYDKISVVNAPYSAEGLTKAKAEAIIKESQGKQVLAASDLTKASSKNALNMLLNPIKNGSMLSNTVSEYTKEDIEAAEKYLDAVKTAEGFKDTLKLDLSTISTDFISSFAPDTSSGSSSSSSSKEDFDWVETKINRLSEALERLKDKASDAYSTWSTRNASLQQAIATTQNAIDLQSQAYQTYMNKANSIGLSDTYKTLVQNGALRIDTIYDEDLKEKISDYQEWYDKAKDCLDTQRDLQDSLNELNSQKFENLQSEYDSLIESLEKQRDLLEGQITVLTSASTYNQLRNQQNNIIENLKAERNALSATLNSLSITRGSEEWTNLSSELTDIDQSLQDAYNKLQEISKLQFDNLKEYYELSIDLAEKQKDLAEGRINLLSSSSDYQNLANQQRSIIQMYEQELNQLNALRNSSVFNEMSYSDQMGTLSDLTDLNQTLDEAYDTLREISKLQFDNVKETFEFDTQKIEHYLQLLQDQTDLLETKGLFANEKYYNSMISYTQQKIDNLQKEKSQLQSILNNSSYQQGTSEWNDMFSALMDIDEELSSLNADMVEFNNNIRDLNWDIFEYLEESLSRITSETDYLVELLSKEDLYDKDTGEFTKYADATVGLHAAAYDVYKQQAQDYYEEVQDLQKQLVNGAGKDVLEQYNNMVDAHQDAVKSALEEKQAILDLIEQGYNAQLDALQELIDKKKEALNQEKNLHDYQKNVKDKTENIASLEKQKASLLNDASEDAMSKIQKIEASLKDAREDLQETEYEQYLQDSQDMLDQLAEDYEDWMNARLDQSDALLAEIVGKVGEQGGEIKNTLTEVADRNGTMLSESMNTIFSAESPFTSSLMNGIRDTSNNTVGAVNNLNTNVNNGINNINGNVTNGFTDVGNKISGTTTAINNLINKVADITNAVAKNTNAGSNTGGGNGGASGNTTSSGGSYSSTPSTPNYTPSYTPTHTTSNSGSSSGSNSSSNSGSSNNNSSNSSSGSGIFEYLKDSYPKDRLDINNSIVDRLKYRDYNSTFSARSRYWQKLGFSGTYTGSSAQNTKMLNWMKNHGYRKGTDYVPKNGYYPTQEEGLEVIEHNGALLTPLSKGDKVFNSEATQRLFDIANNEEFQKNVKLFTPSIDLTSGLKSVQSINTNNGGNRTITFGDTNVSIAQASNIEDIVDGLTKSKRFEDMICYVINEKSMGRSTVGKNRFVRH